MLARDRPRAVVFEHALDPFDPDGAIRRVFGEAAYGIYGIRKTLNGWRAETLDTMRRKGHGANDYIAVPRGTERVLPGI